MRELGARIVHVHEMTEVYGAYTINERQSARVGGDEFAVLLPEVADEHAALDLARRINDAMRTPFMLEQQELTVTASVGVALS
ncbi:MAG: diguanylate cyclase domain-containing protein [Dermatophilaceae bacterium]